MRSLVCALVILAACSKPGGIELDVDGAPDGVNYVRVYIGTAMVPNVPSLSVPDSTGGNVPTTTSQVFAREADNANDLYEYKAGESLNLEFESGSDQTSLPAVIIVGFAGDGSDGTPLASTVLTDLPLDPHDVTQYKVELGAAGLTSNAAERLFLWSPDATTPPLDAACVGFVGPEKTAFIVTPGDTDCDGDPDGSTTPGTYECDPYVYKARGVMASLADGMCTSGSDGECRLGGESCVDGVGPTPGVCNTTGNICMPSADCDCQGTGSGTPLDCLVAEAAAGDATGGSTASPLGYSCMIGTDAPSGGTCTINVPRPPTGGFGCVPPGMNSNTGIAIKGNGAFDTKVDLDGTSYTLDVTASCGITLTPMASTTSSTPPAGLLLRLDLADPDGPSSLILPIGITFSGDTCASSVCTATGALSLPSLPACAAGWTTVTDTQLAGSSPTLNAAMTEMFFIADNSMGAPVVWTATRQTTADGWLQTHQVDLGDLASAPVFIHLGGSDSILYVVDAAGIIQQFTRATPMSSSPWMVVTPVAVSLVGQMIDAYAPDNAAQDAIVATSAGDLYEVGSGSAGGAASKSFTAGQTPFMTDDDLNLWYAEISNTTYSVYVSSRVGADVPFAAGVEVDLGTPGTSTFPQAPWLSSDLTTMFFASNMGVAENTAHIYSATR